MKKSLLLLALLIFVLRSSAQTIENPFVQSSENTSAVITKIATGEHYTAVTFKYTAPGDDAWADLNKEIFIQTDVDNKHYNFVKATGISIHPEKTTLQKAGDELVFTVYFQKIPSEAKSIDIIERPVVAGNGSFFNFYNVHLEKVHESHAVIIDSARLYPPPATTMSNADGNMNMGNIFNSMAPMIGVMTKAAMDAQLNFYQDEDKIKEVAKTTYRYYKALIAEGFSADQALKIVTTESLLPKANLSSK